MYEFFVKKVKELYNIILQPINSIYKKIAIIKYKKILNIDYNENFGQFYYNLLKDNKERGIVYTPEEIAMYIIKNTVQKEDIISNPYIKIVDPACGCGNIIIPLFKYLYNLYIENLEEINLKNNLCIKENDIKEHIIRNNIYGVDIDNIAIMILYIDLFHNADIICKNNILNKDFLNEKLPFKFNIILGNPPYIGHKTVEKNYFKEIKEKYKEVYKDKGDLSYCFFKGAFMNVNKDFKISFITSRYFMESQSGENLRKFIINNFTILKIVDFYGIRPFKNTGIDPVIIFLRDKNFCRENSIKIIKPIDSNKINRREFIKSVFLNEGNSFNKFFISSENLKEKRWILKNENELNILNKIRNKSKSRLRDICESYQGIITGCDKAFIIKKEDIVDGNLEEDIIRPWIKSSSIEKNYVNKSDKFIIYSNDIENIEKYPNIKKHLDPFKEKLLNRRECKNGIRKWYELQWGRKSEIFEKEKIVFPYKSKDNRFALDKGSYFSADIYCMCIKENINNYSYNFLLFLLNSKLYKFYFQSFGKKLGEDLYEYYPNTLMDMMIPKEFLKENFRKEYLYKYFDLTEEEIDIIEDK